MKSDHPAIDSRYVLHEAVQAHHYGLNATLALRAVTTTPAELLGKGHRIGYIKVGHDAGPFLRPPRSRRRTSCPGRTPLSLTLSARLRTGPPDVVLWQSHPLQLGATPAQVFIDGIPQLDDPQLVPRPPSAQVAPSPPDYSREIADVIDSRGETELAATERVPNVVFVNVASVVVRAGYELKEMLGDEFRASSGGGRATVVVHSGEIVCAGDCDSTPAFNDASTPVVNLEGGSISPGLTAYGASVGLSHIDFEPSTGDSGLDPFELGRPPTFIRHASDALVFDSKQDVSPHHARACTSRRHRLTLGANTPLSTSPSAPASPTPSPLHPAP